MSDKNELPKAFNWEAETNKTLARKKRAVKKFKFTSQNELIKANELAYYLFIFNRYDEALEVCSFIAQAQFNGNFNLWSPVERVFALYSRLLRGFGKETEAAEIMKKVKNAGYVKSRLNGDLLYDKKINEAIADKDKIGERDLRCCQLEELCFILELRKYHAMPELNFENQYQINLIRLQEIFNVEDGPAV